MLTNIYKKLSLRIILWYYMNWHLKFQLNTIRKDRVSRIFGYLPSVESINIPPFFEMVC